MILKQFLESQNLTSLLVILEVFGGQVLMGVTAQGYFRVGLMLISPVSEHTVYILVTDKSPYLFSNQHSEDYYRRARQ